MFRPILPDSRSCLPVCVRPRFVAGYTTLSRGMVGNLLAKCWQTESQEIEKTYVRTIEVSYKSWYNSQ